MSDAAVNNRRLIFITGASRSGTTLLNFLLRNHRAVFGLRELQYFGDLWDPQNAARRYGRDEAINAAGWLLARHQAGVMAARLEPEHVRRATVLVDALGAEAFDPSQLYAGAVHWMSQGSGKSIPCEQTPRYIFYAERLLQLYPHAQIVHMVRDPRAVMASQKMRWRRRALAAEARRIPRYETLRVWVNYHPYTTTRLWNRATAAALRLAEHPRVTLVRFEDLVTDPQPTVRQLCARLGLDYDDTLLDVPHINSSHRDARGGARRGLHTEALDTWRRTLSGAEVRIAERRCGEFMQRFGYGRVQRRACSALSELRYRLSYPVHLCGVALINPRRARTQLTAMLRAPQLAAGVARGTETA